MMRSYSVKLRIVKPLDRDWDDVGPRLRDLAWLAHRVLNGTMSRLAMAAELPDQVPDEWRSRRNEHSEKRPGGKPSAYQMTACAIERANAERVKTRTCAWCKGEKVEPAEPPSKRRRNQPERAPGEPCSRCNGVGAYSIGEPVDVPSAIQSGWQRLADRRHANDRADVLRGAKSIASFRAPAPIAVTSSGEAFVVRHDGRGCVLEVPLFPGGAAGRVPFAVAPDGGGAHAHLRAMLAPGSKVGDLKILCPDKPSGADATRAQKKRSKWIAVITYSTPVEEPTLQPACAAAVLRLAGDGSPELAILGRKAKRLYEGPNLARRRAVFALRRAGRSKHQRDIGAGARGHGFDRMRRHYHAIDDAERRWIRSICQEVAVKAVREAHLRGCRGVDVDDGVARVLPPATLRGALDWALAKAGYPEPPKDLPGAVGPGKGSSEVASPNGSVA